MTSMEMCREIGIRIGEKGGKCYFVGGCVRDGIMGKSIKDIDIEVHGVEPNTVREVLSSLGVVNEFGVSFGIFNLKGYDIDIAMPRCETCTGRGHRDFDVYIDPHLGEEKAARRRDFTVNALMKNVVSGEILDFFGGLEDIGRGVIRHVNDESFAEDPLRVLRACQFAARFEFSIDPVTRELCRSIDISTLAGERVYGELVKALMSAERPSIFFEELRKMDQLSVWFPEVKALLGVEQPPKHHPEGDVWTHTMMVLDEAAKERHRAKQPLYFMLSALCHDFGKPETTTNKDGVIHSIEHEYAGIDRARDFLSRIYCGNELIKYVKNMVKMHMRPNMLASCCEKQKSFNKMFDLSVCPEDLLLIAKADYHGRGGFIDYEKTEEKLKKRLCEFFRIMERPYVMGRGLIEAGLIPDKSFTKLLERSHKLRLAGVPKGIALKEVRTLSRELKKTGAEEK